MRTRTAKRRSEIITATLLSQSESLNDLAAGTLRLFFFNSSEEQLFSVFRVIH